MSVSFKKFNSLTNTHMTKTLEHIIAAGLDKQKYLVTEKVHGANFSVVVDTKDLTTLKPVYGRRTAILAEDEKFFDYKPVVARYEQQFYNLATTLALNFCALEVVIYGELFGGNISNGMAYPLEQDFIVFDILVNGHPLPKDIVMETLALCSAPYEKPLKFVPVIAICSSLEEALKLPTSFTSKLNREGFKGNEACLEAEGLVIEPVNPSCLQNGSRVYLKQKTQRFSERGNGTFAKQPKLPAVLVHVELLDKALDYITTGRFETVRSKLGDVTIKDIVKVTSEFTEDVLQDMKTDNIRMPEYIDGFVKELRKQVLPFVRPLLLAAAA